VPNGSDKPTRRDSLHAQVAFTLFTVQISAQVQIVDFLKLFPWMKPEEWRRLNIVGISLAHAVVACALSLLVIHGPDNEVLLADKIGASTPLSELTHAFSCGYFLIDILVVLHHKPVDLKFLVHGIVCGAAYWLAQAPLFQYYTIRFLLFELSTPWMNLRHLCDLFHAPKPLSALASLGLMVSFLGCRIAYGISLGYDFTTFLLGLVQTQADPRSRSDNVPAVEVLYFCVSAVVSMCSLNLLWLLLALFSSKQGRKELIGEGQGAVEGKKNR